MILKKILYSSIFFIIKTIRQYKKMCDVTVINSRILRNKNKIGNSKKKSKTLGNSMNFNMNVKAPLFAWKTGPSLIQSWT